MDSLCVVAIELSGTKQQTYLMLTKFKSIPRNDNTLIYFNIMDNESDISITIVHFHESRTVSTL